MGWGWGGFGRVWEAELVWGEEMPMVWGLGPSVSLRQEFGMTWGLGMGSEPEMVWKHDLGMVWRLELV